MDKVQLVLGYLRKYHFWLLCVLAIAAGVFGWMSASGALSEEYKKGKSTVEGKFSSLQQIRGNPNPPNPTWKEQIDKLTDQGREEVRTAWESVYGAQQQVLEWPEETLGPNIVRWLEANPDEQIPQDWRVRYRNEVVSTEFPKLLAIVEARLQLDTDGSASQQPQGEEDEHAYKVDWLAESQEEVHNQLAMPDDSIPDSQVVRLRQEDLWVYRALLNIIRNANEGTTYTSRVKQIKKLVIGAEAAKEFQRGMKGGHIDFASASGGAGGEQQGDDYSDGSEGEAEAPDANRYVDENGNPLGPGLATGQQFKRLPVYMKLEMNQTEITRLLTHCANYALPVEVKQLRMNPEYESGAKPADLADDPSNDDLSPTTRGPMDAEFEIHGIIYIYNPPDNTKLGITDAQMSAG